MAKHGEEFEFEILSIGPVWTQILMHYDNGRTGKTKVRSESVKPYKVGETVRVNGYMTREEGQFGETRIFVVATAEELQRKEADKWWGYFLEQKARGSFHKKAVEKLHKLGCHEHDEEISAYERENGISRWWGYFQERLSHGEIHEAAVRKLHNDYNCHTYDPEIEDARKKINGNRLWNIIQANARQGILYSKGITELHRLGIREYDEQIHLLKRRLGKTSTPAKKEEPSRLAQKKDTQEKAEQYRIAQAKNKLERAVWSMGHRYTGPDILFDDIPGECIYCNYNSAGTGMAFIIDDERKEIWCVKNNTKSVNWEGNNIRINGGAAYAAISLIRDVKEELKELEAALEYAVHAPMETQYAYTVARSQTVG